jgi:hypothetical protein
VKDTKRLRIITVVYRAAGAPASDIYPLVLQVNLDGNSGFNGLDALA